MARPCKIPTDPALYAQLIEDLAYGLPQVRIAESLGVPETTLSSWKKRPTFRRDVAIKKLEILRQPVKDLAETSKLTFLERHPDTRDIYGPPTQKSEVKSENAVLVKVHFVNSGGENGNNPTT